MNMVIHALKRIREDVNITVLTLPPIPALTSTQQTSNLLQFNTFLLEELEGKYYWFFHLAFAFHT
jgi:hypothetical protein